MFEELVEALAPLLLEALALVLTLAIGYVTILLRRYTGITVEAKHREALHSAMMTGAQRVVEAAGDGRITAEERAAMRQEIVAYARRSTPGAISALVNQDGILWDMAEAKLRQVLGARTPL